MASFATTSAAGNATVDGRGARPTAFTLGLEHVAVQLLLRQVRAAVHWHWAWTLTRTVRLTVTTGR